MEWLQQNWLPLLIVILVALGIIGYIIYLCNKKGLRKVALDAILIAEKQYNSTTGQERMTIAIDYMYEVLPSPIKLFLSKDLLTNLIQSFIQKIFDEVKQVLDYHRDEEVEMIEEVKE